MRDAHKRAIELSHKELTNPETVVGFEMADITARLQEMTQDYKAFKAAHQEVVVAAEEGHAEEESTFAEQVRSMYMTAFAILKTAEETVRPPENILDRTIGFGNSTIRVETARAPEPGEFDGKPESWPAFRDRFKAEVHDRELDDVTKLLYLQKACVVRAKETLGDWQPVGANYVKAWESLERKFEDSYRLEQALVSVIVRMPRAKEESTH